MSAAFEEVIPTADRVELRMRAQAENLVLARLALGGVAASVGASAEVVGDLKLAVTEACTNAVQHAYAADGARSDIVVRLGAVGGKLRVEVEDFGGGFAFLEGDDLAAQRRAAGYDGGMGLRIIEAVTDEFHIQSTPGGTRVMFARWLDGQG